MGEITLLNGKVIKIDVDELSVDEWEIFTSIKGTLKQEKEIVSKCTGITFDEIGKMSRHVEYPQIISAILKTMREPYESPNSQSASTLPE